MARPWANPIEAHFGPLRQFTIANSNYPNHPVLSQALDAYLRWRNANARHRDVLAAERKERAVEAEAADLLLGRARQVDAQHRELHRRPVSAESLRKELHIGTERSRQSVRLIRASQNGDAPQ